MTASNQIQYLNCQNIDKTKWDACIAAAPNGLIYAYSFYLDAMAKHWDALVLGDYEVVMPLVWNKKLRFYYIYSPAFTGPLGIFGKNISSEIIDCFLNSIPDRFKLCDLNLNTNLHLSSSSFKTNKRTNHILFLQTSYSSLFDNFRSSYKQLIKKSSIDGHIIKKDIPPENIIDLCRKKMVHNTSLRENDLIRFEKLFYKVKQQLKTVTYGV